MKSIDVTKNELRKKYFAALHNEIAELVDKETGMLNKEFAKDVNCLVCSENNYSVLFVKAGYTFVRCKACGHVYTNPQVKEECLNELYGTSEANDLWQQVTISEQEREWKRPYYEEHLEQLLAAVDKSSPRILDLGCATGQFLEIVREKVGKCKGIELSDFGYKYCKETLKLDVENKTLNDCGFSAGEFDAVTLFGVLEHLPRPKEILEEIAEVLPQGGICMAIVPNVYSLYHMIIKSDSVTFDGRNHLSYFSSKTLTRLFNDTGYDVVLLDTVLDGYFSLLKNAQFGLGEEEETFLDEKQMQFFSQENISKICKDYNLGLRLRIIAKKR
jgi:2-polyprenyl-3-methyl-5-hydroxy-6-metoxy-1,4-benzoquinol methylase